MPVKRIFWPLVRQDFKWQHKSDRVRMSRPWRIAYAIAIALVIVGLTTYGSLVSHTHISTAWYVALSLPWIAFGTSIASVKHEWKNGTVGWWLSLPTSRLQLLTSKFVAVLLRVVLIGCGLYCVIGVLGLYTMGLQGQFHTDSAGQFLLTGAQWVLLAMAAAPFASAFGMLFPIARSSKARPAMPLIWIIFVGIWWVAFSQISRFIQTGYRSDTHTLYLNLSPNLIYPLLASWILAYLLIRFAARVLDRYLTL
ncbi:MULTISPECIES: ABC transporter permease subunit [Alicyclobacillus]|uniref:ABC transporter permease subunit n=1 Tax=Alicyclobacillus acidoterrestris (strain ATCC 49025 / DSM 3922 / CIP 106132 / NCIMB 13137 / GD3B) TaxID=1356854 RepID=T0BUP0_ALIAG|nr:MULTISPECIES: ABC transporter permease subunit [Alicyclobacillus]EPZ44150.1 hypothetical protein N007_11545 [Alicyclobacillus acidoterrestris ATCC 49025]UNO49667.1 ABC transporter permease subunit [Alicyclobacillus acidoterrestris]